MKFVFSLLILFVLAVPAFAECDGNSCAAPVRNSVRAAGRGVGRVVRWKRAHRPIFNFFANRSCRSCG